MSENQIERHGYYDKSFEFLDYAKGKDDINTVTCIYINLGEDHLSGLRGKLTDFTPYESINIEGKIIRFVGEIDAIMYILIGDKVIFKNEQLNFDKYDGYLRDPLGLINAQKEMLGYSVREEELNKSNNIGKSIK